MGSFPFGEFAAIALVHLLAVASPGPDFAVVVRQSVGYGRKAAIDTSLGVGCGILVHVGYSILGIGMLVSHSLAAFSIMKWIGAAYLLYIGIRSLQAKPRASADLAGQGSAEFSFARSFRLGFLTNALNPKATLFFVSLFTVVIDPKTPLVLLVCYGLYMALATALWFSAVSLFFGHQRVRRQFQRLGHWFERLMGGILVALSIKLAVSTPR